MMRLLLWTLPILLLFRVEVFHFFMNLTFIQWILLLSLFSLCLFFYRRKIKYLAISSARKLKYFNLRKYRRKLSRWAKENNAEAMGKFLVSQIERNVFTKLGCIALSTAIFSHYPSLMTGLTPATIFLLTLTAYSLLVLAFRKEMLISMVGIYSLMAVVPYIMAFLSHDTGINLFETLPIDIINILNINISDLTQTANKLFLFNVPWIALIILFTVLSSVIIRGFLTLIFTVFLKVIQSTNSV
jgi:hypothetical protein